MSAAANGDTDTLLAALTDRAADLGFDAVSVTRPDAIADAAPRLRAFLDAGMHGEMGWMADTADRRAAPFPTSDTRFGR